VFPGKGRHRTGRKKHGRELRERIAPDAVKGQKTMPELASEYGIHANQADAYYSKFN